MTESPTGVAAGARPGHEFTGVVEEGAPRKSLAWTASAPWSVKGLRARGGFAVDIVWQNRKVTAYRITSPEPRKIQVRVNGEIQSVSSSPADYRSSQSR